jgi:hypothetical protein
MISNAAAEFDADGNLTNETAKKLIGQLLVNLTGWTRDLQKINASHAEKK